jgi:hypothetical protein
MRRTLLLCVLLLGAACAPAIPSRSAPPPASIEPTHDLPPVAALLGHRARLELTSTQVVALDSIAEALHARNDAVRHRLRAVIGTRAGGGSGRPPANDEEWLRARPHLRDISENNREAMDAVAALLDERQRQAACEIQGRSTGAPTAGADRPPAGSAMRGRHAETAPRAVPWEVMLGYRVGRWSWCAARVETETPEP